ncbi:MAG: hypothetical protein IKO49_00775 [Bacilli bacterium]|nr:hypothetical protein [Bacilli bacterium]
MIRNYSECAQKLVSFLPNDWEKCVFSLLVRNCEVNGNKAISKEFQCKCISNSIDKIIDLVRYYDDNFEVEDLMFEILDFWYDLYKSDKSLGNFVIFKLYRDGNYEIKTFSGINSDIDNKIVVNTVEQYLIMK